MVHDDIKSALIVVCNTAKDENQTVCLVMVGLGSVGATFVSAVLSLTQVCVLERVLISLPRFGLIVKSDHQTIGVSSQLSKEYLIVAVLVCVLATDIVVHALRLDGWISWDIKYHAVDTASSVTIPHQIFTPDLLEYHCVLLKSKIAVPASSLRV